MIEIVPINLFGDDPTAIDAILRSAKRAGFMKSAAYQALDEMHSSRMVVAIDDGHERIWVHFGDGGHLTDAPVNYRRIRCSEKIDDLCAKVETWCGQRWWEHSMNARGMVHAENVCAECRAIALGRGVELREIYTYRNFWPTRDQESHWKLQRTKFDRWDDVPGMTTAPINDRQEETT